MADPFLFADPLMFKVYLSFCLVTGIVMCFYGYRAFRLILALLGVVLGGYAAGVMGYHLSDGNLAVMAFCGLTGSLLGGVLLVALYLLGVFVYGAVFGTAVGAALVLGASEHIRAIVVVALAVIGGVAALFLQRIIIITATALQGALFVTATGWLVWTGLAPAKAYALLLSAAGAEDPVATQKYVFLGVWLALACLGVGVQVATTEETEEESASTEPVEPAS